MKQQLFKVFKAFNRAGLHGFFNDHSYLSAHSTRELKKEFASVRDVGSTISSASSGQHLQAETNKLKKKRRRYRNELESLLPPPVDVEQYALQMKPKIWKPRTAEEERELIYNFQKVCLLQLLFCFIILIFTLDHPNYLV
ncbi:unnamed protein product [Gongylonema pulchrum]|uniref:Uncharacterized protein n=1 Tax=Gongylonema pulchrum TaxID=637853 RepID=A0A183D3X8_9BILA|nr:unnamed protein product [Gongylonema pulchrum]